MIRNFEYLVNFAFRGYRLLTVCPDFFDLVVVNFLKVFFLFFLQSLAQRVLLKLYSFC